MTAVSAPGGELRVIAVSRMLGAERERTVELYRGLIAENPVGHKTRDSHFLKFFFQRYNEDCALSWTGLMKNEPQWHHHWTEFDSDEYWRKLRDGGKKNFKRIHQNARERDELNKSDQWTWTTQQLTTHEPHWASVLCPTSEPLKIQWRVNY